MRAKKKEPRLAGTRHHEREENPADDGCIVSSSKFEGKTIRSISARVGGPRHIASLIRLTLGGFGLQVRRHCLPDQPKRP